MKHRLLFIVAMLAVAIGLTLLTSCQKDEVIEPVYVPTLTAEVIDGVAHLNWEKSPETPDYIVCYRAFDQPVWSNIERLQSETYALKLDTSQSESVMIRYILNGEDVYSNVVDFN